MAQQESKSTFADILATTFDGKLIARIPRSDLTTQRPTEAFVGFIESTKQLGVNMSEIKIDDGQPKENRVLHVKPPERKLVQDTIYVQPRSTPVSTRKNRFSVR
jgi:hypothetical protein